MKKPTAHLARWASEQERMSGFRDFRDQCPLGQLLAPELDDVPETPADCRALELQVACRESHDERSDLPIQNRILSREGKAGTQNLVAEDEFRQSVQSAVPVGVPHIQLLAEVKGRSVPSSILARYYKIVKFEQYYMPGLA